MAATFSLTFTGAGTNAGYVAPGTQLPVFQIDDTNATVGIQQKDMRDNSQINILMNGAARKCTIDSYRSDPSKGLIFLLPV